MGIQPHMLVLYLGRESVSQATELYKEQKALHSYHIVHPAGTMLCSEICTTLYVQQMQYVQRLVQHVLQYFVTTFDTIVRYNICVHIYISNFIGVKYTIVLHTYNGCCTNTTVYNGFQCTGVYKLVDACLPFKQPAATCPGRKVGTRYTNRGS